MAVSVEEFVRGIVRSGLMSEEYIIGFVDGLPEDKRPKDSQDLAKSLIAHKKLTAYQAERIEKGEVRGLVLGEYVVLEPLGAGGMGMVYKARHRRMERQVAIKVLPPAISRSPEEIERFQREMLAMAILNHPNIVTAYDASEFDGVDFFVMEYVDGNNLYEIVKKDGVFPIEKACDYFLQAAKGIDYAHRKGVVHRDIKPANLLLDKQGTLKILDMGLARFSDDAFSGDIAPGGSTPTSGITQKGTILGTVDYMAPEQAADAQSADARSDIYSLGCSLFFALTGKVPFGGASDLERLMAKSTQPAPLIRTLRPEIPAGLEALIAAMLEREPSQRIQSATEVMLALVPFMEGGDMQSQATMTPPGLKKALSAERPAPNTAAGGKTVKPSNGSHPSTPTASGKPAPTAAGQGSNNRSTPDDEEVNLEPSEHHSSVLRAEALLPVSLNELPIGARLSFPLNDMRGRQLLAEEARITPAFLQAMREATVDTVWLHERDIRILLGDKHKLDLNPAFDVMEKLNVRNRASQRLDRELLNRNALDVVKTLPAFKERFTNPGPKLYDESLVKEIVRLHDDAVIRIQDLLLGMSTIRDNQKANIASGNTVVYSFMDMMQHDLDLVLGNLKVGSEREYLLRHGLEMAVLGMALASEMKYDDRNIMVIGLTGLLHDIGMQQVPRKLRDAPRRLRKEEYREVMKHVLFTADILDKARGVPNAIRLAAYQVHERHNGWGYPRGSEKNGIHPFARILAVADVFTALTSARPYRRALLPYAAMEYMLRQTGKGHYDPAVIRALLHVVSLLPIGCFVVLSDNTAGRVIRSNHNEYDRPMVEVTMDRDGETIDPPRIVNLATERHIRILHDIREPNRDASPDPQPNSPAPAQ